MRRLWVGTQAERVGGRNLQWKMVRLTAHFVLRRLALSKWRRVLAAMPLAVWCDGRDSVVGKKKKVKEKVALGETRLSEKRL